MTQRIYNLSALRGGYWWNLLGQLGRVYRVSQDIDWASSSKPTYRREYYVEPVPDESGLFRRDSGRRVDG